MATGTIEIHPVDGGARTKQQLVDSRLNAWAIDLLVESVQRSELLTAVPQGISFVLNDDDPRHKGIRISITREPAT